MTDILLRQPARLFGPPRADAGISDIEAIHHGERRQVACFLRGPVDPFPRKFKQGVLVVSLGQAKWIPFWSTKRQAIEFDFGIYSVDLRDTDGEDDRFRRATRKVVACGSAHGGLDMIVPPVDVPLVRDAFTGFLNDRD